MGTRLATELKKKRAFDRPAEEAYLNLLRSAQWLSNDVERLFKQYGLSEATYNVLRILRGAGGDGLPCLEVASRMVTRVPDITRLIDRLIKLELVKRGRIESDRRVVLISISTKGLQMLDRVDGPVDALVGRLFSHMKSAELKHLSELLEKARQNVGEPVAVEE
jgi:DNA-binding MarR family transcriptional regulator